MYYDGEHACKSARPLEAVTFIGAEEMGTFHAVFNATIKFGEDQVDRAIPIKLEKERLLSRKRVCLSFNPMLLLMLQVTDLFKSILYCLNVVRHFIVPNGYINIGFKRIKNIAYVSKFTVCFTRICGNRFCGIVRGGGGVKCHLYTAYIAHLYIA